MPARTQGTRAGGFVTAQFVVVVALSLVFFVFLCNAVVFMYGRGVVRAALEEGVRAGGRRRHPEPARGQDGRAGPHLLRAGRRRGAGDRGRPVPGLASRRARLAVQERRQRGEGAAALTPATRARTRRRRRARSGGAGYAAVEFVLGICLVVLPVALLVLSLPIWSERQSMAQRAAEVARNYGLPAGALRARFDGALQRGATVTSRVTVPMPALAIPLVGRAAA